MNTFFLCATQYTNVGDLLINKMLIEELSKYGKVFVDVYKKPIEFQKALIGDTPNVINLYDYNQITLRRFNPLKIYKFFKKEKINLITTNAGPLAVTSKTNLKEKVLNLIFYYLKIVGAPLYLIGRCCSTSCRQGVKIKKGCVEKFYVRSILSVDYLKQNHIQNVEYIPDLAFLYSKKVDLSLAVKKRKVALSFRKTTNPSQGFLKWIQDVVDYFEQINYKIVLYYQVEADKEFMSSIYERIEGREISFIENQLDYNTLDFYKDINIVISNRLHCLLVGACYGCIPYAELDQCDLTSKIDDVFASSFTDEYKNLIDYDNNLKKIGKIVDNYSYYYAYVRNTVKDNADICQNTIKCINQNL